MGIKMEQVKEESLSNETLRKRFYNIQDTRSLIATRQLQFIGKVVRGDNSLLPMQLLTAWVNKKWPRGRPITTTKTSFVKSLQLLYPKKKIEHDIIGNEFDLEIFMDKVGSLRYWIEDAADEKKWQWMIDSKLRFPHLDIPEPNRADPPPPFPPEMIHPHQMNIAHHQDEDGATKGETNRQHLPTRTQHPPPKK